MCAVPYPEDHDLVLAAGEVRKTPGEIERGSLATVSEMINPRPTRLLAHWSWWKNEALGRFAKPWWMPHSPQTVDILLGQTGITINGLSNIDVAILLNPLSSVECI